jgi:hypothetical protein
MRLGHKIKKGLKFGLKLGAGALAIGGAIALGSKIAPQGQSGGGGAVAPDQLPSVPQVSEANQREKPKSDTRKEIDRLLEQEKNRPKPVFRTAEQRQQAIQSTDDFIAKYSKFYPDTRP